MLPVNITKLQGILLDMAKPRSLQRPPIHEAVLQFGFEGEPLDLPQLESLAEAYVQRGWSRQDIKSFQAMLSPEQALLVQTNEALIGYVVRDPDNHHLIQLRPDSVAASNVQHYEKWESLTVFARAAFDQFVALARPNAVTRLSARFINRIPPIAALSEFNQILERPPLPVAELPEASVSDFMRRHVVTGLGDECTALLTIGTTVPLAGELPGGKALVIDIDVVKLCRHVPNFETLGSDLAMLRTLKNKLFFGSLKDAVVENFA